MLVIVDKFIAEVTNTDQKEQFESSSYDQVLQVINKIQSIRESTKNMMNMKRIHLFLTGMEHFEKVMIKLKLDQQHVVKLMGCVWGPTQFLLEFADRTDPQLDNLLDVYEKIGEKIPLLYEYVQLFISIPDCTTFLVHIYRDVVTFHRCAYKLFSLRPTLFQKIYKSTWKSLNDTFDHVAASLEKHGNFIKEKGSSFWNPRAALDVDAELPPAESWQNGSQNWQNIGDMFLNYSQNVKRSLENFEEKQIDEKTKTKEKVLAWISASKEMPLLHEKFQEARICPDTGRWLFKRYSEVTDWMTEDPPPNSAIWLQGSRGFGKTILSSLLIDELGDLRTEKKRNAIPHDSKICYFYCEEDNTDHRTYLDILKGVLHQMVEVTEYILPLCKESIHSSGVLTDVETAETLIKVFFEYNTRQYIVIDGIDECEITEAHRAARFFKEQVTYCDNIKQGRLRVLFMSQKVPELAKAKPESMPEGDACIELNATDNAEDIRNYVKKRIPDFSQERGTNSGFNLSESDKQQIESIICRRSEDMFLYAHLAIEYLLHQMTKEKLIEKLTEEMAPKKLSQIYEKLLGIVKTKLLSLQEGEAHWAMATQLLGWLVCAKRPLKWHEMQSILSYDPNQQKVDFDNKMLRQDSHNYLGSLVHILKSGHIRIVHSTARKHIIQNEYIDEQAVHCGLTIRCLRYLSLISASRAYDENQRREKVKLGWFSFQDYACSQWHSHISTVISKCSNFLNKEGSDCEEFGSALQDFVDQNRADLTQEFHRDFRGQMPADLDNFSGLPFYQSLCVLWNHIYTHQKSEFDVRNTIGIEGIENAMLENRTSLETNFKPSDIACLQDTILDYYGPNLFKCKRLLCAYFHVGYDKKEDREAHNNRHDRPYQCSVRCNAAPIGFTSKKDLERHVRIYHPEQINEQGSFEQIRSRTGAKEFPCSLCGKKFTRKINQVSHERSHFGERPYKCTHMGCDKAFTRISDCQRHQKIHTRIVH